MVPPGTGAGWCSSVQGGVNQINSAHCLFAIDVDFIPISKALKGQYGAIQFRSVLPYSTVQCSGVYMCNAI